MSLIEKMRRAREREVEAGGHKFTVRRPTDEDVEFHKIEPGLGLVKSFVVGWDFKELDVINGGGPEAVPFNAAVWSEWVADHPEVWEPLGNAIVDLYKAHKAQVEADAKN